MVLFGIISLPCELWSITINDPVPSRVDAERYEINSIIFTGDIYFKQNELINIISSGQTELSLPHRGVRYLYEQFQQNKYTPNYYLQNIGFSLENWENEFRFFNQNKVEIDSAILHNFYNLKGFHDFKCSIDFYSDSNRRKNILEFKIKAGKRWKFGPLVYRGLDSLPHSVDEKLLKINRIKRGEDYDETKLYLEIEAIKRILLESGYLFAVYNIDYPVHIDRDKLENTVVILFKPGIRQKIGKINFIDSLTNQTYVSSNMKKSLMDIKENDYYSPLKISRSELNLYSLGTFKIVKIDTSNTLENPKDSILDLNVILGYREQHSYGAGLFFNQTTWDQAYNIGVEGNYINRNIFGAAQLLNPFVKFTVLDINRAIQNWPVFEYELSAGVNFTQPMLWNFPSFKVGFSTQPSYSYRIFNKFLNLETWSLPFNFSTKLPDFTYFQHFNLNFTFERQDPKNFDAAMRDLWGELDSNATAQDTTNLLETFTLYNNLNTYVRTYNPLLTANLIGGSLSGDTRDNPFSPTRGYLSNISIDGLNPIFLPFDELSGAAKYARIQFLYLWFKSLTRSSILGFKFRAGYLYWWDKQESYVPSDRQFFAGGANSVRGWGSRKLRYYNSDQLSSDLGNNSSTDYATDYVGNTTLIETSFEYRFRFTDLVGSGDFIAEQLSSFGAVAFLDVGNAFQWMIVDSTGNYLFDYSLEDYILKLGVAVGFGFRYETPVGPVRIDFGWPFYDPMRKQDKFVFQRERGLTSMIFHIGLGHAF